MNVRTHAILIACTMVNAAAGLCAQTPDEVLLEVEHVSEKAIVVRVSAPQATNVIALKSEAGIVVIDTEVSPTLAAAVRRKIVEVFGRSDFAYAINTHHHGDHTYGNQVFSDAEIVGLEGVRTRMEESEQGRRQTIQQLTAAIPQLRQSLEGMEAGTEQSRSMARNIAYYEAVLSGLSDGFRLTPPTLTFTDTETLRVGELTLEMVYFGLAHSETDILVFCPELNLIATGDLFSRDGDLYIDSERQPIMDRWVENLDRILSESYAEAAIVPGHGEILHAGDIRRVRDFVIARQAEYAGKTSAFFAFRDTFEEAGLEASLSRMDELLVHPDEYFFLHAEFDSFAYRLMLDGHLDRAVPLFEKLALLFPDVPNAFDSLGEAYLRSGAEEEAATAFERCLELDPEHRNARERLSALREKA